MYSASCLCGNCKITISNIVSTGICHCILCRKMTSSAFSLSAVVAPDGLKLESGDPRTCSISQGTETGSTLYFCGDCGSALWTESTTIPGFKTLKAGLLDGAEALDSKEFKPKAEQFVERRPQWLRGVEGTTQVEGLQEGVREILMKKLQRAKI